MEPQKYIKQGWPPFGKFDDEIQAAADWLLNWIIAQPDYDSQELRIEHDLDDPSMPEWLFVGAGGQRMRTEQWIDLDYDYPLMSGEAHYGLMMIRVTEHGLAQINHQRDQSPDTPLRFVC